MNLKVREANANDYIDISNLVVEVHNLHVKNRPDVFLEVGNPFLKEQFEDLLNNSNTKLFVVENIDNKDLVAYCIVKIMATSCLPILIQSRFAHIDNFCVKDSYKRNSVGKLLFQHIIDYAKSVGALSLQLSVWEFNQDAIKFYEAVGMSPRNRKMELNL
jgi:diamine N-acetyltransferase